LSKITDLGVLATPASNDVVPIVDVDDATMAASGTTKQITVANLTSLILGGGASLTIAGAPITADPAPAAVNTLYPCDTTSAGFTVTLPDNPANGTLVAVKLVKQGGTNAVTIARGGVTDVFNIAGGVTSFPVSLLMQGAVLQYLKTPHIWYVTGDDLPLSALQTTAMTLSNKTLTGALETVSTNATATGSLTLSVATANIYNLTLTGNVTLTLGLSGSGSGVSESLAVYLTQDGSGGRTVTFATSVTWLGGSAPTIGAGIGALTVLTFECLGGTWYGTAVTGAPTLPLSVANGGTGSANGTATQYTAPLVVTLTDAATIAVSAAAGNDQRVILGGNRTLGVPTSPVDGQKILFHITQDATGSRTLAYASGAGGYEFSTGLPSPTLSTGANVTDLLGVVYDLARNRWLAAGFLNGFA
jgi:hypothetical protein